MSDLKKQKKICKACGREFSNRAKWDKRGIWDQVKYCSKRCKNSKNFLIVNK